MYINQFFHMEDVIRAKHTSFNAIKKARFEKEKSIAEAFCRGLTNRRLYVEAKCRVSIYHYLTYLLEKMPTDRLSDEELELLAHCQSGNTPPYK